MRLNRKLVIAIASILLAGGLVLSFAAWAGAGFDFMRLSTSNTDRNVTHEEDFDASAFDTIEISIDVDDMKVQPSKDGQIHLRYTDRDNLTYTLTTDAGVLKLEQKGTNGGWFNFDLFSFVSFKESDSVLLELPAEFAGDLNFSNDVGDTDMEQISLTGALDCVFGTGSFDAEGLKARSVTVQGDVGTVNGDGWNVSEYVFLSTETGDIALESANVGDLTCQSDVGRIKLDSVTSKDTELSTETGDISLKLLAMENLTATTDVGEVKGTLAGVQGDYSILTNTDVGDSNLKDQIGQTDKEINITTETGDIDLQFQ